MDIQWLLTFNEILKTGTFAKAADELGYTQSTVTFQIHQLEKELSIKLFDKIGRKMQLSDAGRAVIPMVQETIDSINRLKSASQKDGTLVGTLSICAPDSIFRFTTLYDAIYKFLTTAPLVTFSVTRKTCNDAVDALKNGTVDLAILYQVAGQEDPMLEIEQLRDISLTLIASGKKSLEWDPLTQTLGGNKTIFLTDPRCAFHGVYKRYLKNHSITISNQTIIGDWNSTLYAVKNGLGISIVPRALVEKDLQEGSVRAIPLDDLQETVFIALATHKNKWKSPHVELFTQLVKEHMHEAE